MDVGEGRLNSVVIHFLRCLLSRDIPLIGWTSGARYVIAQRGCLLGLVKGIQMYNIEAGVFTDLERCTPSSVAGISADIAPNDILGVGRPPCADDLLVDVVSLFDHSHWRAPSMSKTCVATRAMFYVLLKGLFVYNVEEAAFESFSLGCFQVVTLSIWSLRYLPKLGARCRDHIHLTRACTWIHQEVFVQNDLNNTFFRASHLICKTGISFESSRILVACPSLCVSSSYCAWLSEQTTGVVVLRVPSCQEGTPTPSETYNEHQIQEGLFRQEPGTWVYRGEHGKFLRQHGVTDCCGLFFLVYSSSSCVWSRLPIIQADHVWCGYASPPT